MIIVYTATNCPACVAMKTKLKNKGIAFSQINIDEDAVSKQKVLNAGFRSVPQLFNTETDAFVSIGDL